MKPINDTDFFDIYQPKNRPVKDLCEETVKLFELSIKMMIDIKSAINGKSSEIIKGKYTDMLTLLFITRTIEIIDDMAVLMNSCCIGSIKDELRVLFETCVSSKFIYSQINCERYAAAYMTECWTSKIKDCEMMLSDEYKQSHPFFADKLSNHDIKEKLNQQICVTQNYINKHFKPLLSSCTWKKNKSWYQNLGVANFKELCKNVKFQSTSGEALYADLYGHYSLAIHGKSVLRHLSIKDDGFYFKSIRNPNDVKQDLEYVFIVLNDYAVDLLKNFTSTTDEIFDKFRKYMDQHIDLKKKVLNGFSQIA